MREYQIKLDNGDIYNASYIGVNHTAYNMFIGATISAYDKEFDNSDLVCLESGMDDIRYCTIGDVSEAYKILKNEIKAKNPVTLLQYSECIQNTIFRYFGDYSNIKNRLSFFPDEDDIENDKDRGCVSDLAHKNAAMCTERAMLAQNLLMEIGINSVFKASGVIINDKVDAHAYNLISHDRKHYIFDVTIPTILNDRVSPIICEIPKEVYDKISQPSSSIGYSVRINHYNPLQHKDYDITYDAGRKDVYDVDDYRAKKVLK